MELSWKTKNLVEQQKRKLREFYYWPSLESVFDHIEQKYEK